MKKFLIISIAAVLSLLLVDYLYFSAGILYVPHMGEVEYHAKADEKSLYLDRGDGFEAFEVRGVNLGLGKPGYFATDRAITKEEYLRWFQQIQDMGANVIRTYTLAHTNFYEAFYEYNVENSDPLYLIHGVWVNDYLINSTYSALEEEFYEPFLRDCKAVVDAIHGRYKDNSAGTIFPLHYKKDISSWVFGYILGIEWEGTLVGYTDYSFPQLDQFQGEYFYTENGSNFEIFLASIAEEVARYETNKYGSQRVMAFSNWPTTDPLDYPKNINDYYRKFAKLDVEHIRCTNAFAPKQFASYHIYPYHPDYYKYFEVHEENTYLQYLREINDHHSMPVVITEFGIPSSRGRASEEQSLGRNQGGMNETQQGEALVSLYQDIMEAGCAGGVVFSWQDEWFKRTWNTWANVDLLTSPYWSDYQTNEQSFGILTFDPGEERSVCYVDGDRAEWTEDDLVSQQDGIRLSMKYDEKFVYFLAEQEGFDLVTDRLYIPIDTTPKSGSTRAADLSLSMSDPADFVIEINGRANSRLLVQERYDIIESLFYSQITPESLISKTFPAPNSDRFSAVRMLLVNNLFYQRDSIYDEDFSDDKRIDFREYSTTNLTQYFISEQYETGKLTYGNANPDAPNFNSLADFCAGDGFVEIKLPWQLLNFADPSNMRIHDDYYEVYGVEYLTIDEMRVGAGDGTKQIQMQSFPLEKLGKHPKYHERLKESYYILQKFWNQT